MKNGQRLRVHAFSISLDGYGAGPDQSVEAPLGVRGEELHGWVFPTRTWARIAEGGDGDGGTTGIDDDFMAQGFENIGATVMGRNMFGPVRGEWPDESWRGWWGDDPVYHHPVFVLTHYPRADLPMEGGTTFHFITDGLDAALDRAFAAAEGRDVRLGGGVSTVRECLRRGLVDYAHLPITPVLLGRGERLLEGLTELGEAYSCRFTPSEAVVHAELERRR